MLAAKERTTRMSLTSCDRAPVTHSTSLHRGTQNRVWQICGTMAAAGGQ
jgi:hypothetical protein